jgi:hypothetical protein
VHWQSELHAAPEAVVPREAQHFCVANSHAPEAQKQPPTQDSPAACWFDGHFVTQRPLMHPRYDVGNPSLQSQVSGSQSSLLVHAGPSPCAGPSPLAPELLAPELLAPELLAPELLAPELLAPELLAPELLAPELPPESSPPVHAGTASRPTATRAESERNR